MRNIIVGTAGHIDHGKTALVKALTGTDPDRLKEEKERGITIDIGFAHLDVEDVRFGFIDVPGHERFVKNMLAGVGGIDLVILVVAADESVMPQTREHFDICRLLKIETGLIVLTKTDLVDADWLDLVENEVRELTTGSFLEKAEVLRVSSRTGAGLATLQQALLRLSQNLQGKSARGLFRLPIDRAFTMRGFGTVVTGTLLSGKITKDEEVEIQPGGRRLRVRGVQVYGEPSSAALAGQRTALNLHGVEVQDIERGMVLSHPDTLAASLLLDVRLQLLPGVERPLKTMAKVRFHHGTCEILCRVALLGQAALKPGETSFAQLRLEMPATTLVGDRFIIREFSPVVTLGGGVILDSRPDKHKQNDASVRAFLAAVEAGDEGERLAAFLRRAESAGLAEANLTARTGLPRELLLQQLERQEKAGKVRLISRRPIYVVDALAYRNLGQRVLEELKQFHALNPLLRGISKEELRERLFGKAPFDYFKPLLEELASAQKVRLYEEVVALYGREIALSAEEQTLKGELEDLYRRSGVEPPALDEALTRLAGRAGADKLKKIYYLLIKERALVKISEDLTLHQQTLADIKARLMRRFPTGSLIGVGDFKGLFNISRKFAIPILEHLDRERITRRSGDKRVLV